ncbi:aldo/keto reductase [Actinomadura sp. KC345]|uniref:aldo/keto reductase n=1 Tax=Actinomadura sp. KC345 TaxID=2530371 RepID=UPI001A9F3913|nr:aldo/keto reductase [Actinomadura sp. KC345]
MRTSSAGCIDAAGRIDTEEPGSEPAPQIKEWRRTRIHKLGRTAVEVTELGFGGGPLGGLFAPLDDSTAAQALASAWDAGIRYFDTSPHYGIGHSERRIGDLLRRMPRSQFTLSTKAGRLLVPQDPGGRMDEGFAVPATHRRVWDFSRDGIRRSVEDSLARIGVDRIDVLYLHDAEEHFEDALRDGHPALAELRAEGVVGAIGAGMHHPGMLTRLVREADVDVVMLPHRRGERGCCAHPYRDRSPHRPLTTRMPRTLRRMLLANSA